MIWNNMRKGILLILIKENKSMTREELIQKINIPWTTMYDNLEVLERSGYITSTPAESNGKKGRPPTMWSVIRR